MILTLSNCALLLAIANLNINLTLSWNLKTAKHNQWWSSKVIDSRQTFRSKLGSSSSDSSFDEALLRKSKGFYSRPPEPTVDKVIPEAASEQNVGAEILVPNSIKISIEDDVRLENIRVKELDGLLDLFYSIIDEKKQLISIEEEILAQMNEIRGKVSDSLLPDLDSAIAEKNRIIDLERSTFKSISSLASSLAVDIYDSREMIEKAEIAISSLPELIDFNMKAANSDEAISTAKEETQLLQMQKSLKSFRYRRDERTLKIIDKFDEVTNRAESGFVRDSIMNSMENEAYAIAVAQRAPYKLPSSSDLANKTNSELAMAAGKTLGTTFTSLITITSSLITASVTSIQSSETKQSTNSTSAAFGNLGNSCKGAVSAIQTVWSTPAADGTPSGKNAIQQFVMSSKDTIQSAEVRESVTLLGEDFVQATKESANLVKVVSLKISSTVQYSSKWQVAVTDLYDSLGLLASFVKLIAVQVVESTKKNVSKQLPSKSMESKSTGANKNK